MKNKLRQSLIAIALIPFLVAWSCSLAQWISVALADLPILTQMGLNIATLAGGGVLTPEDAAKIQDISKEVTFDIAAIQKAYNDYRQTPNTTTLAAITTAIATIQKNLPDLLTAAHIKDQALATRVTAAVGLVLSTVEAFAQLIPQPTPAGGIVKAKKTTAPVHVPTPAELKASWQDKVGVPLK